MRRQGLLGLFLPLLVQAMNKKNEKVKDQSAGILDRALGNKKCPTLRAH